MNRTEHLEAVLKSLPHKPGVYQHLDDEGRIIYVGKAKNLKFRVGSYFNSQASVSGKTRLLVRKIADIKYLVVESEMDALLLENSLIKQHQPRYNINLKDDKSFPSIVIKKEDFPRIFPTRQLIRDGSEYHGPYASVKNMHGVLDLVRKLFPIRTCSLHLSRRNIETGKFKVCLEFHLGNCKGPCEGKQSKEDYDEGVSNIRKIIRGNFVEAIRELKKRMQTLADELLFEQAMELKQKIDLLESFQARSTIVNPGIHNTDVFTIASDSHAGYVNYMKVNSGVIVQGHTIELKKKLDESDRELLEYAIIELRDRFLSTSSEIYVPVELDIQLDGVSFHIPKIGDKKKLLNLSQRNATQFMLDAQKQQEHLDPERHAQRILETLKTDLRLNELPVHIECFDNSNIQGTHPVSSCVVFRNAKPSKQDYRIFNVKTVEGADDFSTMKEVVFRRYKRMLKEYQLLPQLIIIDGGKGQLSAALESLDELSLRGKIAVIGIAKRLEEIYFPGDSLPLYLDKKSESLKLIQHLRNEAHRFGISKHRNKRSKQALRSEITEIKGVGLRTTQILLHHFKSVNNVKAASLEELGAVVNKKMAQIVLDHFKKEKKE
ncbi:MAG: excinuclease ABC subunit UvrC [Flavobacteriales bacterium]|nr:excinuclease ABC subunit UvrC [Flavobacteriales bacterium]